MPKAIEMMTAGTMSAQESQYVHTLAARSMPSTLRPGSAKGGPAPLAPGARRAQAIFRPRVRGTVIGSWSAQYFPLL
jgi:hypothetical protein